MPHPIPRCQVLPLPNDEASFQIDQQERLRWHFGSQYPRPFFYPLNGPRGSSLPRMGHPGDVGHDHHRSIWFAHHKVNGLDFWREGTPQKIRQKGWLVYHDGQTEAGMAVQLGWYNEQQAEIMEHLLIAVVRPGPQAGETVLELQSTFTPKAETLTLDQTNFGFLAVRVAKNISGYFGGGTITNSAGLQGEKAVFGQQAAWMDYSGAVPGNGVEGITYFDHPQNPGHPSHWHVREDGWMGSAFCLASSFTIRRDQPLQLRYLLHAHSQPVAAATAQHLATTFSKLPAYEVVRAEVPHTRHQLRRVGATEPAP